MDEATHTMSTPHAPDTEERGTPPQDARGWHQQILARALAWRERHPGFTFNLEVGDTDPSSHEPGYCFAGQEHFLFFAPFRPFDAQNRAHSIGFTVNFDGDQQPVFCALVVTFGGITDPALRAMHQTLVDALGPFHAGPHDRYARRYDDADPGMAFDAFLAADLPRMMDLIREHGMEAAFLVSEPSFARMLSCVPGAHQAATPPAPQPGQTALLATWRGNIAQRVGLVREMLAEHGAWASPWNFPLDPQHSQGLELPFELFLHQGRERFTYRLSVDAFASSDDPAGLPNPWPDLAEAPNGRARSAGKAPLARTWLRVTSIEPLEPPLTLDAFELPAEVDRKALLGAGAFAVALRKGAEPAPAVDAPVRGAADVEGVDLSRLLQRVNDRIEYLLDASHRLGESYLARVSDLAELREVFAQQVIPLLRQYFDDDLARVGLVLATSSAEPLVAERRTRFEDLFPGARPEGVVPMRVRHELTPPSAWSAASFRGIYEGEREQDQGERGGA